MALIFERWAESACGPAWWDASKFILDFTRARGEGSVGAFMNSFKDMNLICLDDIGVRESTQPQTDALLTFLNTRGERPLIVTGNLAPASLAEVLDSRVVSRLCAGVVIEVTGRDQRLDNTISLKA